MEQEIISLFREIMHSQRNMEERLMTQMREMKASMEERFTAQINELKASMEERFKQVDLRFEKVDQQIGALRILAEETRTELHIVAVKVNYLSLQKRMQVS